MGAAAAAAARWDARFHDDGVRVTGVLALAPPDFAQLLGLLREVVERVGALTPGGSAATRERLDDLAAKLDAALLGQTLRHGALGAASAGATRGGRFRLAVSDEDDAAAAAVRLRSEGLVPTCLPAGAPLVYLVAAADGGSVVDARSGARLAMIPPRALVRAADGAVCEGVAVVRLSVIDPTDPSALATMPGTFRGVRLAAATAAGGGAPTDVQLATLGAAHRGRGGGGGAHSLARLPLRWSPRRTPHMHA